MSHYYSIMELFLVTITNSVPCGHLLYGAISRNNN